MRSSADLFALSAASARNLATASSASAASFTFSRCSTASSASRTAICSRSAAASRSAGMSACIRLLMPAATDVTSFPSTCITFFTRSPAPAKAENALPAAFAFSSEDLKFSMTFIRMFARSPRIAMTGVVLIAFRPAFMFFSGLITRPAFPAVAVKPPASPSRALL